MRTSIAWLLLIVFVGIPACKNTRRRRERRAEPQPPVQVTEPADIDEPGTLRPMRRHRFRDPDAPPDIQERRKRNPPGKVYTSRWVPPVVPKTDSMGIKVKDLKPPADPELRDGMRVGKVNTKACVKGDCVGKGKFRVKN